MPLTRTRSIRLPRQPRKYKALGGGFFCSKIVKDHKTMTIQDYKDQIVWIIGASSGIGAALAHELDARGAILALSARRMGELHDLTAKLNGKAHQIFVLDVTDGAAVTQSAQDVRNHFGRIDRIVFMAAAYDPTSLDHLNMTKVCQMVDINLMGAFRLIDAVLPLFKAQATKGQLALCGSVAGYIGLPDGQPYSATKAALINLTESLYAECGDVIDVKLISPGFVRTPLTDKNHFTMPMIVSPERAAHAIADGLLSKNFEIHFPKKFTYLLKILRLLPYALSLPLCRKMRK